jgi:formamidopyrimidine-DNA glycosylase
MKRGGLSSRPFLFEDLIPEEITMPELPEVETLRRQLEKLLAGSEVLGIEVLDKDRIGKLEDVRNCRVEEVGREGKFLKLKLSGGREIVVHLRMTGHLHWFDEEESAPAKHNRVVIKFPRGKVCLIDPRRFATVEVRKQKKGSGEAVDAYLDQITGRELHLAAKGRKVPVKNFLLDQKTVAGLGNIYVCEVLFRAGIDPWKKSCELTAAEWDRIAGKIRPVLKKAIECRGTSVSDWKDLMGKKGSYQEHLQVYGREGEPCFRCKTPVARKPIGGRSTFYCPLCQGVDSK